VSEQTQVSQLSLEGNLSLSPCCGFHKRPGRKEVTWEEISPGKANVGTND
jgi:hypothetical protein